jgi:hypothetical protein
LASGKSVWAEAVRDGRPRGRRRRTPFGADTVDCIRIRAPEQGEIKPIKAKAVADSSCWYDFTVAGELNFERRFAGRLESGKHGISDPAG